MSAILERPCSNCGARDSLQLDACRGEIACEECGVVVAAGLEEDEGTRYVKDAVIAEVGDETRGRATHTRNEQGSHHEVSKALNSKIVSYLRRLQEKSKSTDAVLNDAVELCRVISVKKREVNERIEKPFATAAACFQLASQRQHVPISHHELIGIDRSLSALDVKNKMVELLQTLNLAAIPVAVLHRDALRYYLMRLRWNIMLCEGPALAVVESLEALKVERLDILDEVVGALLWIKHGADAMQILGKQAVVIKPHQVTELQGNAKEETTILELEGATRYPKARISDILKTMKMERRAIVEHLESAGGASSLPPGKRPRDESQQELS